MVRFRADERVPVLTVITENDLIGGLRHGYHLARQSDSDKLRSWEIPGTAHADNYTIKVGFIDTGFADLAEIVMSLLFGSGEPFDQATLGRLYPGGVDDYLQHFTAALDTAIRSGFIVSADRLEILDLARAGYASR